jgi:predicted metalloprotease with PDZ domain
MYSFHLWSAVLLFALDSLGQAQTSFGPEPVAMPTPIAAPADVPFPGTIALRVDLTDTVHRLAKVHETVPVEAGEVTLLYPQWIPGRHGPDGPIEMMSGLVIRTNAKNANRIPWTRDAVNMYAFHIDVSRGVTSLDVDFDYLSPMRPQDGRVETSYNLADLAWNTVVLYPAGYFSRDIHVAPSVVLPSGWSYATALVTESQNGNTIYFQDTTLNSLVDSPLEAGENFKRIDLSTGPGNQVHLDIFADEPKNLEITPEQLQDLRNMVVQAQKLFASHHYQHYDFLLMLTDVIGGQGLEHHQSCEVVTRANYFTDWGVGGHDGLTHEYTHSWNGKFMRPDDLWTPNFNVPKRDDLLWVYEGLTQYWGVVLAVRSGLESPETARDTMAGIAATYETSPGRNWRTLVDTTSEEIIADRHSVVWRSAKRAWDYYFEGLLIWLDVDTKIRELSNGQRSLDDFAKEFFGVDSGGFITHTYTFQQLVGALNKVQPYDWDKFLRDRVYSIHPAVPERGFTQGGYRLAYNDTPPVGEKRNETGTQVPPSGASFSTSLGITVISDGTVSDVTWDSPAFRNSVVPGMRLLAVNGNVYSPDRLRHAIQNAETDTAPIRLLVQQMNQVKSTWRASLSALAKD